jgi:hypothetical protein
MTRLYPDLSTPVYNTTLRNSFSFSGFPGRPQVYKVVDSQQHILY